MGWKWEKAGPDSVVWGQGAAGEHGHAGEHGQHVLIVRCDSQEDLDEVIELLGPNDDQ